MILAGRLRAIAALVSAAIVMLLSSNVAWAATLTVGPSGTHTTIQAAIDAAADGDLILIQSGTYLENLTIGKDVTLQGGYSADFSEGSRLPRSTVIDGNETGCPALAVNYSCPNLLSVTFIPPASPDALYVTIDGVEVTGGTDSGVVIDAPEDSRILLNNNLIQHNTTASSVEANGGGVRVLLQTRASVAIQGSSIISNTAVDNGGGLYVVSRAPDGSLPLSTTFILHSSVISDNTGLDTGGVWIDLQRFGRAEIDENFVIANFANSGAVGAGGGAGGIYLRLAQNSSGTFHRNQMISNRHNGSTGYAGYGGANILLDEHSRLDMEGTQFTGNHSTLYTGGAYFSVRDNSRIVGDALIFDRNVGENGGLRADLYDGSAISLTQGITLTHNQSNNGSAGAYFNAGYSDVQLGSIYAYDNWCNSCSGAAFYMSNSDAAANFWLGAVQAISNTAFSGSGGAGYLYLDDGSYANIDDSYFAGNYASNGGALYISAIDEGSEFYLRRTHFISNTAQTGGALYFSYGYENQIKVVEDNQFIGNEAVGGSGGAIYNSSDYAEECQTATFNRNVLRNNLASGSGGGMYISSEFAENCNAEFKDNIFEENVAGSEGGGLRMYRLAYEGADVTFSGNRFARNRAGNGGGGIYMDDLADSASGRMIDNEIVDNVAGINGGGDGGGIRMDDIAYYGGRAEFRNNLISGNIITGTYGDGGGVRIYGTGDGDIVWFTGNVITGNLSPDQGGGLYWDDDGSYGAIYYFDDNEITHNRAEDGGGCYFDDGLEDGGPFYFRGNNISNNIAEEDYGGCYFYEISDGTLVYMTDNRLNANTAGANVGGLSFNNIYNGSQLEFVGNEIIGNSAGYSGTTATGGNTGGLYFRDVSGGSFLRLQDNVIAGNRAYINGAIGGNYGGLWIDDARTGSEIRLLDNQITNNVADASFGGAVLELDSSRVTVQGNLIGDNLAALQGGGLAIFGTASSQYFVEGNQIINNSAAEHGGLWLANPNALSGGPLYGYSFNNLIADNSQGVNVQDLPYFSINDTIAHNGGSAVSITGALTASVHLSNTIVWGNGSAFQVNFAPIQPVSANYSTIQGGFAGTANLDTDPLFVNAGAGDFHLQATSPAVDSADSPSAPLLDLDKVVRPINVVADRGAYEWHLAGVELETEPNPGPSLPGVASTFLLTVTNSGNGPDTFVVDVPVNPLGWPVVLGLQAASTSPLQVTLNPGESGVVEIQVTVPPTAVGGTENTLLLRVQSQQFGNVVDTAELTVVAANVAGVQLTPNNSAESATGSQIVYVHSLTNGGNFTDTITLNAVSAQGWGVVRVPAAATLAPGASTTVRLTVTVPANAGGLVDITTVTATSAANEGTTSASATDTTTAPRAVGVQVAPGTAMTTGPGVMVSFTHRVTNTGNASDVVALTYAAPAGWTITGPATVNLNAGQGKAVTLQVTPPASAAGELQLTSITATSQADGTVSATAQNSIQVADVGVQVTPGTAVTTDPNVMVSFTHRVTNTGNAPDVVALTYAAPAGWTITGPATVNLNAGQGTEVTLQVTPPANAAGELRLTSITATSQADDTVSATAQNSIQVAGVGVQLLFDNNSYVAAGATVVYSHTLVNTGTSLDTFAFSYASSAGWQVEGPETVQLAAGDVQVIEVSITVPSLDELVVDVTTVTATSTLYGERQATAIDTTQGLPDHLYMPNIQVNQR